MKRNYAHEVVTDVMHSQVPNLLVAQRARDDFERVSEQRDELLTALEAIRARINGVFDHPALVAFGPLDTCEGDCAEIARAAIAKATGEK